MLAWELVGAVVGAGLASGREIASFFSRYGNWSWLCIAAAVSALVWLGDARLPSRLEERWWGKMWRGILRLLLIATGGAMLSGAGEIAALTLPVHGAYWIGMAATFLLSWLLASKTLTGLAWISRLMLAILAALIGLGFTIPPMHAAVIDQPDIPKGLLGGLAYGGFNAALMSPILAVGKTKQRDERKHIFRAGILILVILFLGNAVLLRHHALLDEPMPFLEMMQGFGKTGYRLGAVSLYLAILSTLTACSRGLNGRPLPCAGMLIVSLAGFSGVVERIYPLLGILCFCALAAAKFLNRPTKAFHSDSDML